MSLLAGEFRGAAVERSKIKICDVPAFLWFVSFAAKRNEHLKSLKPKTKSALEAVRNISLKKIREKTT